MTRTPGWTDRIAQARLRIGRQAIELFLERGFDHVTVAEIAAAAAVGERTVYRHFPTKEAIVLGTAPGTFDRLVAAVRRVPDEVPAAEAITRIMRRGAVGDDPQGDRDRMRLLRGTPTLRAAWYLELRRFESGLADWLAARRGLPDDDLSCQAAAAAIVTAHRIANERWDGADRSSFIAEFERVLALFADIVDPAPRTSTAP